MPVILTTQEAEAGGWQVVQAQHGQLSETLPYNKALYSIPITESRFEPCLGDVARTCFKIKKSWGCSSL